LPKYALQDAASDETIFKGDILVIEPRYNDIVLVCLDYSARLQIGISGEYLINQPNRAARYITMPDDDWQIIRTLQKAV